MRTLGWCVELVATFLYHEMLKRNTLRPMRQLIQEEDEVKQIRLLRNWAQQKANECSYIQLAVRRSTPTSLLRYQVLTTNTGWLSLHNCCIVFTMAWCTQWSLVGSGSTLRECASRPYCNCYGLATAARIAE